MRVHHSLGPPKRVAADVDCVLKVKQMILGCGDDSGAVLWHGCGCHLDPVQNVQHGLRQPRLVVEIQPGSDACDPVHDGGNKEVVIFGRSSGGLRRVLNMRLTPSTAR